MRRKPCLLALSALAIAAAAGARPIVVVSVLPQAFFVEKLAGGLVDVEVLIPPGANEASFEPTMQQMQAISRAKVYVKVGHPHFLFEAAWLDRLLAGNSAMRVVDGSAGAPQDAEDPHIWVSPACVRAMAGNIAAALVLVLPDQAAAIGANLTAFQSEIDALDADLRTVLKPYAGREFLVFHPSWGYFAHEYGLVQVSIASEAKEPSPKQLASIIDHARSKGIRDIFVQPQFSRQQADLVAQQLGGRVVVIDPLARDWLANLRLVAEALRRSFQP